MQGDIPNVSEAEVIRLILEHIQGLFPKNCPKCQRHFATYREYLQTTKHIGSPISYDVEFGDWKPSRASGNVSLANCPCGNTIALSSEGMPLNQIWLVLNWVKTEAERRKVPVQSILEYIRAEAVKQVLG